MTDGFVYFAAATFSGHPERIKVGFSKWPTSRVGEFFRRSIPVDLITYVPGRIADEQALHGLLHAYRTDRNEWFKPCQRTRRMIAYCQQHNELPPAVIEAGDAWLAMREAKRRYHIASVAAGRFFGDRNDFGIDWSEAA